MGDVFEGGDCGKGKMEGSGSWELGIERNKRVYLSKKGRWLCWKG